MTEVIDFGKDDIKLILPDGRVRDLLEFAEKYPMSTIQEMGEAISKPLFAEATRGKRDGREPLTSDQVKVILSRFNISSQSSRLSPSTWKNLKDLIKKEDKRNELKAQRDEEKQKKLEEKTERVLKQKEEHLSRKNEQFGSGSASTPATNSKIVSVPITEGGGSSSAKATADKSQYVWATRDKSHASDVSSPEGETRDKPTRHNEQQAVIKDIVPIQEGHLSTLEIVADAGYVHASSAGSLASEDMILTNQADVYSAPELSVKRASAAATSIVLKDFIKLISININAFFKALKKLRITMVSPYYLLLIILILAIIVWMKTGGFFNTEPLEISLPVNLDSQEP